MKYNVKIDGVLTVLEYDVFSNSRGYQYLTADHSASHAFPEPLVVGQKFRTSGHLYEVVSKEAK